MHTFSVPIRILTLWAALVLSVRAQQNFILNGDFEAVYDGITPWNVSSTYIRADRGLWHMDDPDAQLTAVYDRW